MKKPYIKPKAFVENFNLAQSIAINCGHDWTGTTGHPTHADPNTPTCGWSLGNIVYFDQSLAGTKCTEDADPDSWELGGSGGTPTICYNAPAGAPQAFASA